MPNLMRYTNAPAIWIDCKAEEELKTERALKKTAFAGFSRIDGPKKSLGSNSDCRRITYVMVFEDSVTEIDIRIFMSVMRDMPEFSHTVMGSKSLFCDSAAILMDVNHPDAAIRTFSDMDEMVFASSQLVLLHTSTPAENWANSMTICAEQSPLSLITKMRYRASNRGGRPFAKAQLLEQDIDSARAKAQSQKLPPSEQKRRSLNATQTVQELSAKGREHVANVLMGKLEEMLALHYKESTAAGDLKDWEWKLVKSVEGHWIGKIIFQARLEDELKQIMKAIHGTSIEIDGLCHLIEISSKFLKHPKLEGR